MTATPQVLIPFHRAEALSIARAAGVAGKSVRTMREWCQRHDIGRRIEGQWAVSKVALQMHLDGNRAALAAYLAGDRSSPTIVAYFEGCGVPVPKRHWADPIIDRSLISAPARRVIGSRIAAAGRE